MTGATGTRRGGSAAIVRARLISSRVIEGDGSNLRNIEDALDNRAIHVASVVASGAVEAAHYDNLLPSLEGADMRVASLDASGHVQAGSFAGDGSALTGVLEPQAVAGALAGTSPFVDSLTVSGRVQAGFFAGDGSSLTNVQAGIEFPDFIDHALDMGMGSVAARACAPQATLVNLAPILSSSEPTAPLSSVSGSADAWRTMDGNAETFSVATAPDAWTISLSTLAWGSVRLTAVAVTVAGASRPSSTVIEYQDPVASQFVPLAFTGWGAPARRVFMLPERTPPSTSFRVTLSGFSGELRVSCLELLDEAGAVFPRRAEPLTHPCVAVESLLVDQVVSPAGASGTAMGARNAFDGAPGSFASATAPAPFSVEYAFDGPRRVSAVAIRLASATVKAAGCVVAVSTKPPGSAPTETRSFQTAEWGPTPRRVFLVSPALTSSRFAVDITGYSGAIEVARVELLGELADTVPRSLGDVDLGTGTLSSGPSASSVLLVDMVAPMTGAAAPAPFLAPNNSGASGHEGWRAFDGDPSTYYVMDTSAPFATLEYAFDVPRRVTAIAVTCSGTSETRPLAVQLDAAPVADSATMTDLSFVALETFACSPWGSSRRRVFHLAARSPPRQAFRVWVTSTTDGAPPRIERVEILDVAQEALGPAGLYNRDVSLGSGSLDALRCAAATSLVDMVVPMTGASTPAPFLASGNASITGWRAFDSDPSTYYEVAAPTTPSLTYTFDIPRPLSAVAVTLLGVARPTGATLVANAGGAGTPAYVTLQSWSNLTWGPGARRVLHLPARTDPYPTYTLTFTSARTLRVARVELLDDARFAFLRPLGAQAMGGALSGPGFALGTATVSLDTTGSAATRTLEVGGSNATLVKIGTASGVQRVELGTGAGATTIVIGGGSDTVELASASVAGRSIQLNKPKDGSSVASSNAGVFIRHGLSDSAGYIQTNADSAAFQFKAPAADGVVTLQPGAAPSAILTTTSDLSSTMLVGEVAVGLIPALPASKVTSGTLDAGRIPDLDATKVATGTLGAARIPNLDAVKLTTGTLDVLRIPDLDAAKVATGTLALARIPTLDAARVPALDAAKITTGTFDALRIPSLDAAKVATGTLDVLRIPDLDAAKVATGTLALARIPTLDAARVPALDAAKITTGIFDTLRIPSLDAAKVATGTLALARIPTLDAARVPDLDAAKMTTGIFGSARIPDLDAAKIATGTLALARIPTLDAVRVPNLDAAKITTGTFAAERIPAAFTSTGAVGVGTLAVSSALESDSKQTGSVTLAGGLGVAKSVNVGVALAGPGFAMGTGAVSVDTTGTAATRTLELGTANATLVKIGTATSTQQVDIGTGSGVTTINIGGNSDIVNIVGTLSVGVTQTVTSTNVEVTDKSIQLNKPADGSSVASSNAGVFIRHGLLDSAGYIQTNVGSTAFQFKAPTTDGIATLEPGAVPSTILTTTSLLSSSLLSGEIGVGLIPVLPASKITSGTLDAARIPDLDAAKVATGTLGALRIPDLDAAKIATGTLALARIPTLDAGRVPALDAAKITTGIFDALRIPSLDAVKLTAGTLDVLRIPDLDAAKVATGTLALARIPTLDAARVPALDAAKITTGTFDALRIPGLDAAKVATGTLDVLRIPDLDAAKVATGTLALARIPTLDAARVPALDAAKITTGTFDALRIPSLDAAKVATGTLDVLRIPDLDAAKLVSGTLDALRVPNLDAAKVGTGILDPLRIPDLDAAKVATGILDPLRIPDLDAAKVATGTLALARIPTLDAVRVPDLDAAKITTGTLDALRVPSLDATKITTGTLDALRIPDLDAAKVATGTLALARIPTLDAARVPALDAAKITTGTLDAARMPASFSVSGTITTTNTTQGSTAPAGGLVCRGGAYIAKNLYVGGASGETESVNYGNIVAQNDITAFSDARLKRDVRIIRGALQKVRAIRGVTFARVDPHGTEADGAASRGTGLIAQESSLHV
eukprot:tig00000492_g1518.t1